MEISSGFADPLAVIFRSDCGFADPQTEIFSGFADPLTEIYDGFADPLAEIYSGFAAKIRNVSQTNSKCKLLRGTVRILVISLNTRQTFDYETGDVFG